MAAGDEHLFHLDNLINGGLMRTVTPDDAAKSLIEKGLARHAVGGLVATESAYQYLKEKGGAVKQWK